MKLTHPHHAPRRSPSVTVLTAAVLAACAAAAAPAAANPGGEEEPSAQKGTVNVSPAVVSPGDEVDLDVAFCEENGVVVSEAFEASVSLDVDADGGLHAVASVRADVEVGTYEIRADCGGEKGGTGTITVVGESASPVAPVRAGGGGTAETAEESGGLGAAGTAGLAVAGGAVTLGAAAFALRRRYAADRTGR